MSEVEDSQPGMKEMEEMEEMGEKEDLFCKRRVVATYTTLPSRYDVLYQSILSAHQKGMKPARTSRT